MVRSGSGLLLDVLVPDFSGFFVGLILSLLRRVGLILRLHTFFIIFYKKVEKRHL